MPLIDILLPEYDRETGMTEHLLEGLPDPIWNSQTRDGEDALAELAGHLIEIPRWVSIIMNEESFDLAEPALSAPPRPGSTSEAVRRFSDNVAAARSRLVGAVDGTLCVPWTLTRGRHDLCTMPRIAMLRYLVLSHLVHHRGQLTTHLEMRDMPIPAFYALADEGLAT